jgi:hypothetical protein
MNYYDNIFASIYDYYVNKKHEDPRANGATVVSACIMLSVLFFVIFLKKIFSIDLLFYLPKNKYYYAPLIILLIYLTNKYYNGERAKKIVSRFSTKEDSEKRMWFYISIVSIFFPIILIPILLISIK